VGGIIISGARAFLRRGRRGVRRILIDRARQQLSLKRGAAALQVELEGLEVALPRMTRPCCVDGARGALAREGRIRRIHKSVLRGLPTKAASAGIGTNGAAALGFAGVVYRELRELPKREGALAVIRRGFRRIRYTCPEVIAVFEEVQVGCEEQRQDPGPACRGDARLRARVGRCSPRERQVAFSPIGAGDRIGRLR
jgi:hypothetical protein